MRPVEALDVNLPTADRIRELPGFERIERPPHTLFVRSEWRAFLQEDLLEDFAGVDPERRRLYAGGRAVHFSYLPEGAPSEVFVRKVWRGGFLRRILGDLHFSRQRPFQECLAARRAALAGLSVAEPVAIRVTRVWPMGFRFLVLTPAWPKATSLAQLRQPWPGKRSLILQLARELRRLHEAGVYPEDMTLNNILVEGPDIRFVDLDRSKLLGGWSRPAAIRNLSRLNRSCEKLLKESPFLSGPDKLRFLQSYLGVTTNLAAMSRACQAGLWRHRLWWDLGGGRNCKGRRCRPQQVQEGVLLP